MINSQINKSFMSAIKDTLPVAESKPETPFYGSPYLRYRTDDYIMLPNMEEFFYEIIPCVQLIKVKKRNYLIVTGEYSGISLYSPLILLDYVPVLDVEKILRASPQHIDYIDIINTVYIRGYNYYGGIINIVSREGDRAGVKLPSSSSFIKYSTFTESKKADFPDYGKQRSDVRIPDLRITLKWIPQIDVVAGDGNNIEFYTSDTGGEYVIIVQGVTEDGRVVRGTGGFFVE